MSQADGFEVVFEPFVGGRVYERGPDGMEHEWGEIVVWDPPNRVEYSWHIFLDPERATRVSVTFTPGVSGTTVRLENSGFEVFGDRASERANGSAVPGRESPSTTWRPSSQRWRCPGGSEDASPRWC